MTRNIVSAFWLLLALGVSPAFAAIVFEETFESFAEGTTLSGHGGWIGSPLTVATIVLGSKAANGLIPPPGGSSQFATFRPLPTLDDTQLYSVSFDAFAKTFPRSHNSGVFFSDGRGALIAGWYAANNPNTGQPLQSWAFRTLSGDVLYSGGFDKPVRLEIVLDPIKDEVYGRADFGSGVFETPHSNLPPEIFASIDRILIYQDFRFVSSDFLGVEVDNLRLLTSASGLPSTSGVFPVRGGNTGAVSVRISAPGIQTGATAKLTGVGPDIEGSNFTFPSPRVLSATFDLTGVPPGVRNVVVTNPDSSVITLPAAFTVELGGAPNIKIRKAGTTAVPGRILNYFIILENTGNINANNVEVTEFLDPSGFSLLQVDPPAIADVPTLANASAILWVIPELAPGEVKIFFYKARLDPSTPLGTDIFGGPACGDIARQEYAGCLVDAALASGAICSFVSVPCGKCTAACAVDPTRLTCLGCLSVCTYSLYRCNDASVRLVDACASRFAKACDTHRQPTRAPIDPNEKGVAEKKFIQPEQLLVYPIHFENIGNAEAQDVFITDVLDPNLDLETLKIVTPSATLDTTTRILKWALTGRNLAPKETDNVLFSIKPRAGLPSETEIRNKATIQFEIFEPLTTNEVVNVIDSTPPGCTIDPLPNETSTVNFPISWSGSDAVGEIDLYSVLVSVDGRSFTPFLEKTKDTSATFSGEVGKTYGFFCIATDTAGNVEVQNPVAEASTRVVLGDRDGDGIPDDQDGCPDDALKGAPGVCGCGVADTDSDGDGTPNCNDQCPNDPNRITPGVEVCNGIDDNCNGTSDDGFNLGGSCAVGVGACQRTGAFVCSANGQGTQCNAIAGTPSTEVCNGSDDDCDGSVDEGVCAPTCAANVSTQISVTRGGYRRNSATGRYVQQVTLKNTGTTAIQGPVSLALDSLSSNATLFSPTGNTSCATPVSPYKNVNVGADNVLSVGETASVVLEFTNPTNAGITYGTRVLGGSAAR